MGHQKPDPYKQQLATPTIPQQHRIPPRDPDIYLSTSPWQTLDYKYECELKTEIIADLFAGTSVLFDQGGCRKGVGSCHEVPDEASETLKTWPDGLPANYRNKNHNSAIPDVENLCQKLRQELPPISPIITDNKEYFYRNKMEYALYWDNSEHCIRLAFHQRNSHRKIPFTQSSIERPEILAEATRIIDELNAKHAQARDYQSLMIRCDQQGTVASALFEKHKPHPVMPLLKDTLLGITYTYSPNGFFQINLPVYELALEEIQKHIITDEVLDLYAGVGTIGLSVAPGHRLTLVETNKSAYSELVKNCEGVWSCNSDNIFQGNENDFLSQVRREPSQADLSPLASRRANLTDKKLVSCPAENHCQNYNSKPLPILAKAEEATDFITSSTTVILDPPRAGLNPKLIDTLNSVKPPTIIYLSCNPVTQARDIAALIKNYKIKKLQPFNFFPRTPHIENLAILTAK